MANDISTPQNINSLIAALPKAELHVHLEGTIAPATAVKLAARHGVKISEGEVAERYAPGDFLKFLEAFKWVTSFLRTPEDHALIAEEFARALIAQNVVYAEVTLSIGVMLLRKQDPLANYAAIRNAVAPFEKASGPSRFGLQLNWIFDAVRQFGAAAAIEVVNIARQAVGDGVVAFGIGGDELGLPTRDLIPVYEAARATNLVPLIHAGEIGGPEMMRDAIEMLGVRRIGHGIAAMNDAGLMDLLTERRIALEVCPTSNLRTGALSRHLPKERAAGIASHPLRTFVQRGVPVTLSSDDPTMFDTSLLREYELASQSGLSKPELMKLAQAGFEYALISEAEKERYISALRAAAAH